MGKGDVILSKELLPSWNETLGNSLGIQSLSTIFSENFSMLCSWYIFE